MAGRSAFGREKNNTMPGTSRTQQRAEARYNVTTQFPQYDLHFAAASGNLGLVEFALSHGQPINSVLNGVLPLHAACAGGSEVVVKYLIDEGADVNAPRIPRRYSNERHKSSGLAVGASGSTPLHFAAANGHLGVVKLLLAHGAVPDRADKHGVTPEMLARENGWVECAEVLSAWSGGRAGDLPPVVKSSSVGEETGTPESAGDAIVGDANANTTEKDKDGGCELAEFIQNIGSSSSAGSKRLHVKRSIDNALHLFKAPLLHHHGSQGQLRVDRDRDRDRERDVGRGREKSPSPPSPSARSHTHTQAQALQGAHSQSGLPSPGPGSHLHALFHHGHGHSHSTSQLGSSSNATATAKSLSHTSESPSPSLRPTRLLGGDLSMTQSPISSSNPNPSAFDSAAGLGGVPGHRRPSLPHIFNDTPASPFQRRLSGRKRRPRSAGEDAEQQNQIAQETNAGTAGATDEANDRLGSTPSPVPAGAGGGYSVTNTGTITTRKLSSKISLRNLFRRAQTTGSEPNPNLNQSGGGSEPGSNASSYAQSVPIYSLAYAPSSNIGSGGGGIRGTGVASASASASTPTPPASPLSASFTPSASSSPAPGSTGNGRPGSWHRSRLGSTSETGGPGPGTVPRSPLVPSAVELHHRYSQDQLQLQQLEEPEAQTQVVAPRLSARRSILRAHNRSVSSQSSNGSGAGTPAGGPRTLRFDASSAAAASASPSPEPRWSLNMSTIVANAGGNASATRLRETRSASSLRHEHSFNEYDDAEEEAEEEEEEEEDYGTSIAPSSASATRPGESSRVLAYGDAELGGGVARDLVPLNATAGRTRGASFTSTASYASSPGVESADTDGDGRTTYENKEFPFSLDKPPLTPLSTTSGSESVTTRDGRPTSEARVIEDGSLDVNARRKESDEKQKQAEGERKATAESRGRGNSISSIETDESARSQNGNASSSTSALTNIPTPSPGTDLRMTAVLGDDNDTDVPRTIRSDAPIKGKRTSDAVYLHTSPSSSLDDLDADPDADAADADVNAQAEGEANELQASATAKPASPMTPPGLDLRGISNLAEAEELVRRAQQAILASASLPANGPESPDVPLSAQLAAYGEILALERRFARGEKQRENWGMRDDDSDGERHDTAVTAATADLAKNNSISEGDLGSRKPQSAKEARMILTQKKRDALTTRQRGATTGSPGLSFGSSLRQKGVIRKPPKYKRPHTAEGAPQASWGSPVASMTRINSGSPSNSTTIGNISASAGNASSGHHLSHSRSSSTPLYIGKEQEKLPDIAIIETTATPVDSPKTPESASAARPRVSPSPSSTEYPYAWYTLDETRPALPLRSRTPDPDPSASTDDFGVPLTRVSTAPLQDLSGYGSGGSGSYGARGSSSALRSDPAMRRTGSSHKLSKMGFSVDAHTHPPGTRHHHIHQSHSASPHPRRVHGRDKARDAWDSGYAVYSGGASPASSAGSSRSPSKARFGGIRSLVRGLKGKS